ncbi:DUF2147 domain-containing protein [Aureicoccus marinus]|jgi:uncharacterized protein (DUF2147 family)|uniref:DUF2147 domain-containing protein n=1 Tax=Aureicoccus marinus TaxID=754435 RepID=A0A2S7T5M4_9FLAO|nr:DUF2147 domain-containing protein [Aureicoccus marinus]PQJ14827.1 hypothetical protein BST99_02935 [Aureicoccus marinus]
MRVLPFLFFFSVLFSVQGQSIEGLWQTIDDQTGEAKAVVKVYKKSGLLYGEIQEIVVKGKENARCEKCRGQLKNKPLVGLFTINGFKEVEGFYKGKQLFDPEQGKSFRGKVWLDPDNTNRLKVRGYLGFLYRTQTWIRLR